LKRLPSIPKRKIAKLLEYADNPNNWVDVDTGMANSSLHNIKHAGFEIYYSVDYKTNEEDHSGRNIGQLPIRSISFKPIKNMDEDTMVEFVKRTVQQFGFTDSTMTPGKNKSVHVYEEMFVMPDD